MRDEGAEGGEECYILKSRFMVRRLQGQGG